MRFLFVIQGEGRGHLTQALALAGMLRRHGHEVAGVLVGLAPGRSLPDFFHHRIGMPVEAFEAPRFAFDRCNRSVSMLRTLWCNASPRRLRAFDRSMRFICRRIGELRPDRIISFYELLVGLTLRRYGLKVPMTGIAHQFLLLHARYPYGRHMGLQGALLRLHARLTACGCGELLALSFRPMADDPARRLHVVPPLLRPEALAGETSDDGFFLAYMVNNGFADELLSDCVRHPRLCVRLFRNGSCEADFRSGAALPDRLTVHRLDDTCFLEALRRCRGYLTTAGFESVCEAMYHGKPMLLVPAHIEQRINAADAVAAGAGEIGDRFDLMRLEALAVRRTRRAPDPGFRRWVDGAERCFLHYLVGV